ncbi:MAG: protein-L-isoaspartate(D-aspartate) O-methyltransferase, partial [Gemmatimonadota bacterium]
AEGFPPEERRWERQRRRLVETVTETGISDLEVLRALFVTPRHHFLPEAVRHRAYEDAPVPIGFGQTASQPSLQALYLQTLGLGPDDRVLEVGTGCGYQTALLAQVAGHVYSVERIRELSARARDALDALRVANVALLVGDGTIGWSRYAPYDAILVAAGAPDVPSSLVEQLAPGGRMLVPLGDRDAQRLTLVTRREDGVTREALVDCTFVPLIGRFGWQD